MKILFIPALLLGLTFASCKNKTDNNFKHKDHGAEMSDEPTEKLLNDPDVDEAANSVGSSDYDELLDSYESYIESYISLMKKASSKNGDISDMEEYLAFMKKAQDLSSELDKNQDDMTSEQKKRFNDLQDKFAKSLMEIK